MGIDMRVSVTGKVFYAPGDSVIALETRDNSKYVVGDSDRV
jgi:hypothetical protein